MDLHVSAAGRLNDNDYLFGRGAGWFAFVMTCGLMLFDYIDRQVIVSLFPDLKEEWGLSGKQLATRRSRSCRSTWTAISPRTSLFLVALTLVGAIAVATKLIWPFQLELDRERFFAVQAAIRNAPDPVIIFGDSIVQGATLPSTVCGVPLVNAGVRGAGIGYFLRHSAQLLGSSRPRLIVLAVGINNAAAKERREVDFQNRYDQVVASLASKAPVVVATVTPIKEGYFVSKFGYDPQIVPALNRTILATPSIKAVIDLNAPLSGANFTIDGVHLNPAGYALWTSKILNGIETALGCI